MPLKKFYMSKDSLKVSCPECKKQVAIPQELLIRKFKDRKWKEKRTFYGYCEKCEESIKVDMYFSVSKIISEDENSALYAKVFATAVNKLYFIIDEYSSIQAAQIFGSYITGVVFQTYMLGGIDKAFNKMLEFRSELILKEDKIKAVLKELYSLFKYAVVKKKK